MKKTLAIAGLTLAVLAGCSKKEPEKASADLAPLTPPPVTVNQPVTPPSGSFQPASNDFSQTPTATPAINNNPGGGLGSTSGGGKRYTVKAGDTLYQIALKTYGNGSAATRAKIVAANPGLNPDKINAGQTIVLP